jgi:hypothetical protein
MLVVGQLNDNPSDLIKESAKKKQSGQLVLEYLLLMMFAVALATLIKTQFIGGESDDPDNAGIMTQMVYRIVQPIASDTPSE